jgi:integrase
VIISTPQPYSCDITPNHLHKNPDRPLKEAKDWQAQQRRALQLGDWTDPRDGKEALRSALQRWLDAREATVASSTFDSDKRRLRYLPPSLMKRPVAAVRTSDIELLLGDMMRRGLSPATATRVRALLSSFFGWAVQQRLVAVNPVSSVARPRGSGEHDGAEVFPFDVTGLREVVTELQARSPRQGQLALIMGLTGLRWGEMTALRVRDLIAVPRPTLRVSRSAPDGHEPRNRTKGGKARSIPLMDELIPIVASWADSKQPDDLLFTSDSGTRLHESNWRRAVGWRESCRGRRVHDLRHSAATIWIRSGVDPKTVQTWLGHASAQTTHDIYSHWMGSDADASAVARVNIALTGGQPGGAKGNLGTQRSATAP